MTSQHLVPHLQQVFGIEERILAKKNVRDCGWMRVESAGAFEFQLFLIGLPELGQLSSPPAECKYYYASH
jgi:hypothetical protein